MKEKECYEIVLNTKSGNFQKYIDHCMEKVKLGNVKIVGRQYAITKAFNVLEVLKNKVMELEHYITYKNLRATGPDRRKLLEVNIYVSLKN
ncbi:conserved Plasmodium protein, unknown function [Plasmodium malariae]|uniref:DNA/RNA-binding protein Alba-like domain-containing protein n=1 Tax=Plasmodium malariae TaxID=5858 RepID=A0A1D3TC78_PLAMA|nr:conserved Plasmodium protein, unknown function [Plasmodium malariae]SCP02484.1 conserved Plasmodium protein, unknown function [Plasmodium malariae]